MYLNSNTDKAEVKNGRLYLPIQASHKVSYICKLVSESGWLDCTPLWILPNNSSVAYDIAFTLFKFLEAKLGSICQAHVVGVIHSNASPSIDLVLKHSFFLSGIVSVSKEIFNRTETDNIDRVPHVNLLYPANFAAENISSSNLDSPLSVVYVGRLEEEQKRVSRVLRLLEALNYSGEVFNVDICGSGDRYSDFELLKQRFDSPSSSIQLRLHGWVARDEVARILSRSDVVVLTSDFEGSPLVILEAMSTGVVPVVMYYGDEVRELINHGESGFVVDRGDVSAMASVLCDLAKDRVSLQRMKDAALDASRARVSPKLWLDTLRDMSGKRVEKAPGRQTELVNLMALAMRKIVRFRSNEKLAIWGGGELGRTLLDLIRESRPDLQVVAIVDEKLSIYISNYCNVDLVKPRQLLEFYIDKILIASRYYEVEIKTQVQTLYEGSNHKPLLIQPFATDVKFS